MNSEKEPKNTDKNKSLKPGSYIKLVFIIVILILLIVLVKNIFTGDSSLSDRINENIIGEEGKVETVSVASIQEVLEISELSTAEYVYNSIARAYEEDGTTVRYYVAYEGTINAGINFNEIGIDLNKDDKILTITLPEITIQSVTVDPGSLEYIFEDKKSETENVHKEAFELCQKDLEEKANNEDELLSLARTNAETTVTALLRPWIMQIDNTFTINVK